MYRSHTNCALLWRTLSLWRNIFGPLGSWSRCCFWSGIESRSCVREPIVWHLSLSLMDGCNKTVAAFFSLWYLLKDFFKVLGNHLDCWKLFLNDTFTNSSFQDNMCSIDMIADWPTFLTWLFEWRKHDLLFSIILRHITSPSKCDVFVKSYCL